jgi:arsenate reductase
MPLPYDDPKISDGTPLESTTYDQRSEQIATEMLYLMSEVKGQVG